MVTTIYGEMDESQLERRETFEDAETYSVHAIEYWLNGECVHRSPTINIKTGHEFIISQGSIG